MMAFYDTSVLVAAFWGDHPHHIESLRLLSRAEPSQASCAAHTLAEVYAVMTRLPVKPAIVPEQALLFVMEIRSRLAIISLQADDYVRALQDASERGISGGRVYDALLVHCARKAEAETIYTWNLADFRRIAPDLTDRIRTPQAMLQ